MCDACQKWGRTDERTDRQLNSRSRISAKLGAKSGCAIQIVHYRAGQPSATLSVTEFVMRSVKLPPLLPNSLIQKLFGPAIWANIRNF